MQDRQSEQDNWTFQILLRTDQQSVPIILTKQWLNNAVPSIGWKNCILKLQDADCLGDEEGLLAYSSGFRYWI